MLKKLVKKALKKLNSEGNGYVERASSQFASLSSKDEMGTESYPIVTKRGADGAQYSVKLQILREPGGWTQGSNEIIDTKSRAALGNEISVSYAIGNICDRKGWTDAEKMRAHFVWLKATEYRDAMIDEAFSDSGRPSAKVTPEALDTEFGKTLSDIEKLFFDNEKSHTQLYSEIKVNEKNALGFASDNKPRGEITATKTTYFSEARQWELELNRNSNGSPDRGRCGRVRAEPARQMGAPATWFIVRSCPVSECPWLLCAGKKGYRVGAVALYSKLLTEIKYS